MQDIAPKEKDSFKEHVTLWKSSYVPQAARERIYNHEIYPHIQKMVERYVKYKFNDFTEINYKDAAQEAYIAVSTYLKEKDIMSLNDPFAMVFIIMRREISILIKEILEKRAFVGEVYQLAQEKGWSFDNPPKEMDNGLLRYPLFEDEEEQKALMNLFDSSHTLKLFNAVYNDWKNLDSVEKSINEWKVFFGVANKYPGRNKAFSRHVLRKSVQEYNSLYREHLTLKKHLGPKGSIIGYTLYIRNKPKEIAEFKTAYAQRLYDYLSTQTNETVTLAPKEIRSILQTTKSYSSNARLNNDLLKPAIKEINDITNLSIDYLVERSGKVKSPIIAFTFQISTNKQKHLC